MPQRSATPTQRPRHFRPQHFSQSRTCSWLHVLGISMEPRQDLLIDQTLLVLLLPRSDVTQTYFPPLCTEYRAFQPGHQRLGRVKRDSRKDENERRATLTEETGWTYRGPEDEQEQEPLRDFSLLSSGHVPLGKGSPGRLMSHHQHHYRCNSVQFLQSGGRVPTH